MTLKTSPEAHRIFLIHATPLAIPAINESVKRLWPEAEISNLLDDSLPRDLQRAGRLDAILTRRFVRLASYAQKAGGDGVIFTCSAFGTAIEACKRKLSIPVLKPNEAMIEEALGFGDTIGLVATFQPAIASITGEFHQYAEKIGRTINVEPIFVAGAFQAAQDGKMTVHDELVSAAATRLKDVDVVCFAQFSMTTAAALTANSTGLAVLTTPDSAVRLMQRLVLPKT